MKGYTSLGSPPVRPKDLGVVGDIIEEVENLTKYIEEDVSNQGADFVGGKLIKLGHLLIEAWQHNSLRLQLEGIEDGLRAKLDEIIPMRAMEVSQ